MIEYNGNFLSSVVPAYGNCDIIWMNFIKASGYKHTYNMCVMKVVLEWHKKKKSVFNLNSMYL